MPVRNLRRRLNVETISCQIFSRRGSNLFDPEGSTYSYSPSFLPPFPPLFSFWSECENLYSPSSDWSESRRFITILRRIRRLRRIRLIFCAPSIIFNSMLSIIDCSHVVFQYNPLKIDTQKCK